MQAVLSMVAWNSAAEVLHYDIELGFTADYCIYVEELEGVNKLARTSIVDHIRSI